VLRIFLVHFWRPASSARLHVKLCLHLKNATQNRSPLTMFFYQLATLLFSNFFGYFL
jgi:hypothetical protein